MLIKTSYIALIVGLLIFSGCSQKSPQFDSSTQESSTSNTKTDSMESNYRGGVEKSISTEVPGGISSSGKYTGKDGVSASGIKMIYFSTDRYDIEPDQLQRIMSDMPKIKRLAQNGKVRVEGNCDELGTDEYNHALGLKRAKAVKQVLVNNGIPASKITVISYGESNPICEGHTPPCHAKNRRVEINQE